MRAAAQLLLVEAAAIRPMLASTPPAHFDRPTVCDGWSVRDVIAHCAAALTRAACQDLHRFTPEDNQADVDERRSWPLEDVLAEVFSGYQAGAEAIDAADGALDGIGLGEWIHGGDIREGLGAPRPYTSQGVELALPLLILRSAVLDKPSIGVTIGDYTGVFGPIGDVLGTVEADLETFIRLCGGRRPDPARYRLDNCAPEDFVLFS